MRSHVERLFIQTKDTDPDLRFMALNDLSKEAVTHPVSFTSSSIKEEYTKILLKCLDDETPEVRTEALKSFSVVTPYLGNSIVNALRQLCHQKSDKLSFTSSIYTMAIHNILSSLRIVSSSPSTKGSGVSEGFGISEGERLVIIRILLANVIDTNLDSNKRLLFTTIDYIEILTDLLEYLGKYFSKAQIVNLSGLLIEACYYSEAVIDKRSIIALSLLAKSVDDEQMNVIIDSIIKMDNTVNSQKSVTKVKSTTLNIVNQLLKSNPFLMPYQMNKIFTNIILPNFKLDTLDQIDDDFDTQQGIEEIRSECFNTLITCFECMDQETMESYVEQALKLSNTFITYNPYNNDDDDVDEDLDVEEDGEDDFYMSEEEDEADYDEDEDAAGLSWKLRRDSNRVIAVVLEKFPLYLTTVYLNLFNKINNSLSDDNQHVITEALKTLTKIFKFTCVDGPFYSLKFLKSLNEDTTELSSNKDDPKSLLNKELNSICENVINSLMLNNSKNPKKYLPLFYDLILELSNATDGFKLEKTNWCGKFIEIIYNLRDSASDIVSLSLIRFYMGLVNKNKLVKFGNHFELMVKAIVNSSNNSSNHEIILESLILLNNLVLDDSTIGESEIDSKTITSVLTDSFIIDSLIEKSQSKKYSTEIRQKSLIVLVDELLYLKLNDNSKVSDILNVLSESIKIEFLVHVDLSLINKLFSSSSSVLEVNHLTTIITSEWLSILLNHILNFLSITELMESSALALNSILKASFVVENNLVPRDLKWKIVDSLLNVPFNNADSATNYSLVFEILVNVIGNLTLSKDILEKLINKYYEYSRNYNLDSDFLNLFVSNLLESGVDKNELIELVKSKSAADDEKKELSFFKILSSIRIQSNDESVNINEVLNTVSSDFNETGSLYAIILLEQLSETSDLECGLGPFLEIVNGLNSSEKKSSIKKKEEDIKRILVSSMSALVSKRLDVYLPQLINSLNDVNDINRVILLQVLNQVFKKNEMAYSKYDEIFNIIIKIQKSVATPVATTEDSNINDIKIDEFECNIVSEILATIVKSNKSFLGLLIEELSTIEKESIVFKFTLGSVVKYVFEDEKFVDSYFDDKSDIKELIKYVELSTLTDSYMFNEDILILKELGVSALIFVLHKRPIIAIPIISKVLPKILESEIDIKKKFIKNFNIGLNKYSIDNGINFRKLVYELIYSLLITVESNNSLLFLINSTGGNSINWRKMVRKFLKRSFKDDYHIISICLLIIIKIVNLNKSTLFIEIADKKDEQDEEMTDVSSNKKDKDDDLTLLALFMNTTTKILKKKLKESATRQEVENKNELNKSVLRCIYKINLMINENQANGNSSSISTSSSAGNDGQSGLKLSNHDDFLEWTNTFYPNLLDNYSSFFDSDEKE